MARPALLAALLLAAPAAAHDWAGLGDSRFGAVEAIVPPAFRDQDLTGSAAPTIGTAFHDLLDFSVPARAPHRPLSAAHVADLLGVQDFAQNRRRWTDSLAMAAAGAGGLTLAGVSGIGVAPFTGWHAAGVSASIGF